MSKIDAYQKMAEAVELLEDIGLDIEMANVNEVRTGGNPLMQMMGMGQEPEMVNAITIVATLEEGERPPYPDDPDFDDLEVTEDG